MAQNDPKQSSDGSQFLQTFIKRTCTRNTSSIVCWRDMTLEADFVRPHSKWCPSTLNNAARAILSQNGQNATTFAYAAAWTKRLTFGTDKLAVDGVIYIGEQGSYSQGMGSDSSHIRGTNSSKRLWRFFVRPDR